MGTTFRTSPLENVYSLKAYTRRPKDITDMPKLESFIGKIDYNISITEALATY